MKTILPLGASNPFRVEQCLRAPPPAAAGPVLHSPVCTVRQVLVDLYRLLLVE